jgi:hypothetical protein
MKKSRSWCFTFNNYDTKKIGTLLESFHSELKCEYVFQEEKGLEGTPHLQGVIRFVNARNHKWQSLLDPKIHWERCRNWRNSCKYCCKLDTRNGQVFTNVKGLRYRKTIVDPLEGKTLYKYQKEIIKIIQNAPDSRKIYWFWEPIGSTGKSALAKHLILKYNALLVGGRKKDACFAVSARVNNLDKPELEVCVIDISRADYNYVSYSAIESIKNGMLFSSKYESGQCVFNIPHVIVFCNFAPELNKLSADRWDITKITLDS